LAINYTVSCNPNVAGLLYMTFVVQLGFWVLVFVFKEKIRRFFMIDKYSCFGNKKRGRLFNLYCICFR